MGEQLNNLMIELNKLHHRNELSKSVSPDYFEPGMMEYLDKSEGIYSPETGEMVLRFEVKGTRYEGRTEVIEKMKAGDVITVVRDSENSYNSNNFTMENARGNNVGNMPMELCNAIAPLYDSGVLVFEEAFASCVEPITKRSRHAKQAVLFVELHCMVNLNS
ncbi:MAG: HIRAN domain-containing protein [Oscillospiraceae bacterium]